MPLVSVVMPVYNRKEYAALAVESILRQTFTDFEFIIVDDGSVDGTADVIARYQALDPRIKVHRHGQNLGLVAALNTGCTSASGKYIAIMHSDDLSLPQRLQQQVAYLETHPSIALLGTGVQYIDRAGNPTGIEMYPSTPGLARWNLFFHNSLAHPTVVMRQVLLEPFGFYRHGAPGVEDFDLWVRATRVHDLASLPVALLQYRRWDNNISAQHHLGMMHASVEINRHAAIDLLGHDVSLELMTNLFFLLDRARVATAQELQETGALIAELYRAYRARYPLTPADARAVSDSAARKLFYLSASVIRRAPLTALRLLWTGLRISPLTIASTVSRLLRKPAACLHLNPNG